MSLLTDYVHALRSASHRLRAYYITLSHSTHHSVPSDFIERMFHLSGKIDSIAYVAGVFESRGESYFEDIDLGVGEGSWVRGADDWFSREISWIERELAVGFDNEFEALMFATDVLRRVGDFESECV